jgi:hypothetical protein
VVLFPAADKLFSFNFKKYCEKLKITLLANFHNSSMGNTYLAVGHSLSTPGLDPPPVGKPDFTEGISNFSLGVHVYNKIRSAITLHETMLFHSMNLQLK